MNRLSIPEESVSTYVDNMWFQRHFINLYRALETVLGDDVLKDHVVTYVDDLLIHSSSFSEHLDQLDPFYRSWQQQVSLLTLPNITNFSTQEINFLEHIVCDKTVKVGRERILAILRYPVPKNQKRLRKCLSVCNFHQMFNINYTSYVEQLLILLRKGNKWGWSSTLQNVFETLRAKFADSIHLVHPDDKKAYIINTDGSGKAIGRVLLQESDDGQYNIVSTASRLLSAAERRYTT
jgi:hypothetical protein